MKSIDDIIFKGANLTDQEKTAWVYGVLEVKQMMKEYALEVVEELGVNQQDYTDTDYGEYMGPNMKEIEKLKQEIKNQ